MPGYHFKLWVGIGLRSSSASRSLFCLWFSKISKGVLMCIMTPWNWSAFRIAGPLWRESNGDQWFALTKANNVEFCLSFVVDASEPLNHSSLTPMYNARFILWPPSLSSPFLNMGRERRWPLWIKKGVAQYGRERRWPRWIKKMRCISASSDCALNWQPSYWRFEAPWHSYDVTVIWTWISFIFLDQIVCAAELACELPRGFS